MCNKDENIYLDSRGKKLIHRLYPIHGASPTMPEDRQPQELGPDEEEFVTDTYNDFANLYIACINVGIVLRDPADQRDK